jgi:hypothetical protein
MHISKIGNYEGLCLWQSGEIAPSKAPYDPTGKPVESRQARIGPDLHDLSQFLAFYVTEYPDARYVIRNVVVPIDEPFLKSRINQLLMETGIQYPAYVLSTTSRLYWRFCSNTVHRTSTTVLLQNLQV